MFALTAAQKTELITDCGYPKKLKSSRALPAVFTEHGAIMAAAILNTPLAVEVRVNVVRAFMRLPGICASNADLAKQLKRLEQKLAVRDDRLARHDEVIAAVLSEICVLMSPPVPPKKRLMGFIQTKD